ncbi:hypothetical protein SNE40_016892 [Patella caerulea]|uniref:Cadherin domain-containing protein n=2 Tax=Patella caerulea TaxID=87958 RepID=A0AAN8PD21_PATCE
MKEFGFKIVIFACLCFLGQCVPDFEFSMAEEEIVGTVVGDISNSPVFYSGMTATEISNLRFGILDKSREPASLFSIDESSGVLSVKQKIDRESVCDYTSTCTLEFSVAVHSVKTSFSNIAIVLVTILDINDNWPTFPANEVHLDVPEGTKIGKVFKITGAVDIDSPPENTIQTYELTLAENIFSLTSTKNLDGSSVINLKLETSLDREKKSGYTFNIIAKDGGTPPKTGTLRVKVTVTDENDNPPVFMNNTYSIDIKEDTPVNFTVLQVKAIDLDTDQNGQVRYHFSTMQSAKLKSLFTINPTTGDIRVAGALSYEAGATHQLIVVALDGGSPPLKTQTVVNVAILDNGNNAPRVRMNTLSSGETDVTDVSESATPGAFLAFVEVEDSDPGQSGRVECSTTDTDFKLEVLQGKGYKVLLNRVLDRETQDTYELKVTCTDMGEPPMSSTANLKLIVADENDLPPVFTQQMYNATISENNEIGEYLVTVKATDNDFGTNAKIRYSFGEGANGQFRMQSSSGIISAGKSFDREENSKITFTVIATDLGTPAQSSSTQVTVTILDKNDNRPTFVRPFYQLEIRENEVPHTVIGQIEAVDEDEGVNGVVEYFMAGSEGGVVPFEVLPNGTVRTTKMLNREHDNKYSFTALARDRGSKPLTNSVDILITVLDINDNKPVILFPTSGNHTVLISVFPEPNSIIGKIIAYDEDSGDNAKLRFSIVAGNGENVFDIDNETGEAMVINNWKLETDHVYDLTVRVEDSGNPILFDTTKLRVEAIFDNKTMSELVDGAKSDKYIVIAATVAGATCVLSLIIITAICLVLRGERRKASAQPKPDTVFDNVPAITCDKSPDPNVLFGDRRSNSKNLVYGGETRGDGVGNKKKEVSFSLDDSTEARETEFHPRPINIALNRMGLVPTTNIHIHNDDIHSDTSGETITSDSGRGGSEEEVNMQPLTDKKHQWQAPLTSNRNTSFDQYYTDKPSHEYRNNKPGQPRFLHANANRQDSYRQDQSFNRSKNSDFSSSFRDFSNPRTMLLPYNTQSSVISHDDDASTTTSGSYTISPEENFHDIVMGKDVIV